MNDFEDIRPYHDHEVRGVVDGLLRGPELSAALGKFRLPRLYRTFPGAVTRLVQTTLKHQLRHVSNIHDVQIFIEKYLDRLIEDTTTGLTHTGLESLSPANAYLFVSNHRDITMDPALVNYMLYHQGFSTLQIATGDNLVKRPFIADLMRLNKSFIVKRSVQGREKLKASRQLSAYIHHCIDQGENVWIAQREGRAKDGVDRTEAAIITMLHMAERDSRPLHESINSLNIVPVSISYEYDPCDEAKARELHAVDTQGRFQKDEDSDVRSILNGMIGAKGDVHVAFGSPLVLEEGCTAEDIARRIDREVLAHYRLHAINYLALHRLQPERVDLTAAAARLGLEPAALERKRADFERRLAPVPTHLQPYVLRMYANPLLRQLESAPASCSPTS